MFDTSMFTSIQNDAGLTSPQMNLNMKPFQFVGILLPYIYGIFGIILIINIITSGFRIMTSQGDPKGMQESQQKLKNSAVGLLILFASFWIVQLLFTFFGIRLDLFTF